MIFAGAHGGAEEVEFPEKSSERRQAGQGKHEDRHAPGEQRRARPEPGKILEVVAAGFAPNQRHDAERADEGEGVDRGVEERGAKSLAPAATRPSKV